ncbi:MAG: hypothetical protein IJZ55_08910 [Lachnospiraceae bacterium]|nr:hypothetical protein [Lachnospiraceae bacterium]
MGKQQMKITVSKQVAKYLYDSPLGTSGCVEALVEDVLENAYMGVDRRTKKELTNITKRLDTAIQKIELKHADIDTTELRGVCGRYDDVIKLLWEK